MWIYRMDTSIYRGDSIYTSPHLTISSCNRGVFMWNRYQHWSEGPKMFNWKSWKKLWRQNLISSPFHLCGSFISYSSALYLSCTRAHVHTHCVKWLFHLENCQNIPREHISLFLSSVSSSRGCVGVCQKCAGIDKTHGAKQLCFIQSLSLSFPSLLLPIPSSRPSLPCIGCEYPASEKSDQTDSQGSVSQHHWGCQSMLVPSCPTMLRARPTLLLVLGLLLHLADAQSKWTAGFHVGLRVFGVGGQGSTLLCFSLQNTHTLTYQGDISNISTRRGSLVKLHTFNVLVN